VRIRLESAVARQALERVLPVMSERKVDLRLRPWRGVELELKDLRQLHEDLHAALLDDEPSTRAAAEEEAFTRVCLLVRSSGFFKARMVPEESRRLRARVDVMTRAWTEHAHLDLRPVLVRVPAGVPVEHLLVATFSLRGQEGEPRDLLLPRAVAQALVKHRGAKGAEVLDPVGTLVASEPELEALLALWVPGAQDEPLAQLDAALEVAQAL
jgi:hypothetical protein